MLIILAKIQSQEHQWNLIPKYYPFRYFCSMCGRITQEKKAFSPEYKHYDNLSKLDREFNIGVGMQALVETNEEQSEIMKFGFNYGGRYNFNARAEGFMNKENKLNYKGPLGIHTNPIYKPLVDAQRCVIPVTSFLEGPTIEKLSKPHKIVFKSPSIFFYLGGLVGTDEKTGLKGFSIITTWTNTIIKEVVGHERAPLILSDNDSIKQWLSKDIPFKDVMECIKPQSSEYFEISELSPLFKSPSYDSIY